MQTTTSARGGQTLSWSTGPVRVEGESNRFLCFLVDLTTLPAEPPVAPASPDPRTYIMDGQALDVEPAVQYVEKVKLRCDPDTYRQFLDILSRYHRTPDTIDEVRSNKCEITLG